ncbi:serine/threonine protein kinase [Spongiactinospora sp. TRM90649]|uniref:serine/threonine-protein kinase n=1 Tax=Spongiactinospora sp. TRM90649 TaxID=3031114 RepID=UPI0023F94CCD|nr:serine/threonine protein kinase [Spongiactinospora sp. TRM90649]MDF5758204.1 protein kinase [Spongiactinospora sp. TRM90649]
MLVPLTPDDPTSLGEFRLTGRLGEGGQGVVYLGYAPSGEAAAVKLLTRVDPESRARLTRELSALESVASFCTARVLTADVQGPRPYVASEFVDGPALDRRVKERGPLRGGDLERLAVGTATALAAVHAAGVVHRDFKPANVLLGPDGPRVVDFGISRAEGSATMTSGLIGTPAYLSPEQIGGSPAGQASDVFAWAATMLYAATGSSPFGADTVPAVLHRIVSHQPDLSALPPRLHGLIAACLSKDPAARPTARALMVSLVDPSGASVPPVAAEPLPRDLAERGSRIASGVTQPGGGHPASPLATQGSRRGRGALPAGIAVVAALLLTGGVVAWLSLRDDTLADPTRSASPPAGMATTTTEVPSAPATVAPPVKATGPKEIPSTVAGTWTGHIVPSVALGLKEHDVRLELRAGRDTGKWYEPSSGCEGTLHATGSGTGMVVMDLRDVGECVPGTVTLVRQGDGLSYTWLDGLGLGTTYTGTLSRR